MEEGHKIDFAKETFVPPIRFPVGVKPVVLDLSTPSSASSFSDQAFTVGKYLEKRGIYTTPLFTNSPKPRCVHLGIDIGAPVGTPVFAPFSGSVLFRGFNPEPGDYGYCLITQHTIQGVTIYFLFGHLGRDLMLLEEGQAIVSGQVLAHLGDKEENGGWSPHVHFQLSYVRPKTHDLPGVCSEDDIEQCKRDYPDPRLVLGPIYTD